MWSPVHLSSTSRKQLLIRVEKSYFHFPSHFTNLLLVEKILLPYPTKVMELYFPSTSRNMVSPISPKRLCGFHFTNLLLVEKILLPYPKKGDGALLTFYQQKHGFSNFPEKVMHVALISLILYQWKKIVPTPPKK